MIHILALVAMMLVPVPELPDVCETHGPCILVPESEHDTAVREYRERQQRIRPAESENDKAMREYRERQEEIRGCRYDAQLQGVCR
jgi:hypothetical protein